MNRRSCLALVAGALGAGCVGSSSPGRSPSSSPGPTDPPSTPGTTSSPSPTAPELGTVEGSWPLPGFDPAGTRFDPDGHLPDEPPARAWTAEHRTPRGSAGVVVADGTVYVAGGATVRAFEATTGEARWSRSFDVEHVAGPVVADAVYVGPDDELHALDPADGTTRWSVAPDRGGVEGFVPSKGRLYATTEGTSTSRGAVLAVADGAVSWEFVAPELEVARFGGVAVTDAVYAVAENAGSVTWHVALDPATGEKRWDAGGLNHSTEPTVANGTLYAGGFAGHVSAQATADGSGRWTFAGDFPVDSVAATDEAVYVSEVDEGGDNLHALDPADGSERWGRDPGGTLLGAGDGLLLVGDDSLRAFDRESGELRWRRPTDGWRPEGVALADGVVFVVDDRERVLALA